MVGRAETWWTDKWITALCRGWRWDEEEGTGKEKEEKHPIMP